MKSLSEIYYGHKKWLDDEARPNYQTEKVIHAEMANEADQYVKELTSIKDNWKNVLKHDVIGLNPYAKAIRWCYFAYDSPERYFDETYECYDGELSDDELKYLIHVELVEEFLVYVANSIKRYFGEEIDLIELVRQDSIDEEKLINGDTTTPTPEQTAREKLLEEWNQGRPKRLLILLEKKGFITKNGDVYNWKIDNDNDFTNNLYVYFVYVASEKFGWRMGKDKQRIPWAKFNPLFPNMATNQNSRNQDLQEIKKDIFPRRATDIDNLFDW